MVCPITLGDHNEVRAWLSLCSEVQMICTWSSRGHCHPIVSCSSKIQNGLPFWCWLTQVVLEKGHLNAYSSSGLKTGIQKRMLASYMTM